MWYPHAESAGNGGKYAFNDRDSLFASVPSLVLDCIILLEKKPKTKGIPKMFYGNIRLHS